MFCVVACVDLCYMLRLRGNQSEILRGNFVNCLGGI